MSKNPLAPPMIGVIEFHLERRRRRNRRLQIQLD
jgi:hypothetical protein